MIYEEEEILSIKADTSSPRVNPSSMETPAYNIMPTPLVTSAAISTAPRPSESISSDAVLAPPVVPAVTRTQNLTGNGSHGRTVIREREIVREGPAGRQKEIIFEEQSRDSDEMSAGTVAGSPKGAAVADTAAHSAPHMTIAATTADDSMITSMPAGAAVSSLHNLTQPSTSTKGRVGGPAPILSAGMADPRYASESSYLNRAHSFKLISLHSASHISTRINPRTGKPLTMPHALSAHSMSPIETEHNFRDQPSHLVREEHEEVSYTYFAATVH